MSGEEDAVVPDIDRAKRHFDREERQRQIGLDLDSTVSHDDLATPLAVINEETPTAKAPNDDIFSSRGRLEDRPSQLPDSKVIVPNSVADRPPDSITSATSVTSATSSGTTTSRVVTKQTPSTPVPPSRNRKRKVTELKCSEIRWFYLEPKGTPWIPFNGRDSLLLELKYRREKNIEIDEQTKAIIEENEDIDLTGERNTVVLNGQYKVDEDNSKIDAIYWKEDTKEIRRGAWFTPDYQPLEMQLSDQIERNHLQYFRGQMIPDGLTVFSKSENSNKPILAELHTEQVDIRWSSVIDIALHQRGSTILRYLWAKSTSLRRGYEKEADWNDAAAEISHLILVVHGIGQKGYENLIATNANQVRDGVVAAMEKCYPDEATRPVFLPVEWRSSLVLDSGLTDTLTIPKMQSMRASLNSTAMDVMYYQSPLFRTEIIRGVVSQLNRVYSLFKQNNPKFTGPVSVFGHSLGSVICYDILTRYSPLMLYDKYVTKSIDEFLENSDDHSNGDALEAMQALKKAREQVRDHLEGGIHKLLVKKDETLDFKVKYLFAVGSPLGVFLVMRGGESTDLCSSATNVERIFNIFHPYDPVAYRLEPFFAAEYKHIRPIKIFSSTDLRGRASYDSMPLDVYKQYMKRLKNQNKAKKKDSAKVKSVQTDARSGGDDEIDEEDECDSDDEARSGCSSPRSMTPPPGETRESTNKEPKAVKKSWFSFGTSNPKKAASSASIHESAIEVAREAEQDLPLAERVLGGATRVPHRIDVQLQPALTDKSYWSVFKSHFSYWTNADLALFLANIMYCKPAKLEEAKPSWS